MKYNSKLNFKIFFIAIVFLIFSIVAFFVLDQREHLGKACSAIERHDNNTAKAHINKLNDVNQVLQNRETMLMVACESGNSEMIVYLLSVGANVDLTVEGGLTPLELFCSKGYEAGQDTLRALLNAGVDQNKYTTMPAAFHLAQSFSNMTDDQLEMAAAETILLLQYGAPLKYDNTSLLHLAAQNNMSDFFYTLVHTKKGIALLSMKDKDGNTPWDVAVKHGSVDVQLVIRNLETEYEEDQNQDNQ